MELLLTQVDIEPLPAKTRETFTFKNEGLLTSNYKEEIQDNFFHSNPKSVFGIKQRIRSRQYQFSPNIGAILKVSVFAIAIIATLS
jgi:hypothetical protein